MALKFLDMTGLQTLWSKAVAKFAPKSHTHDNATADAAGFTKLYGGTGAKEDGAMTQKAATDALNAIQVGGRNLLQDSGFWSGKSSNDMNRCTVKFIDKDGLKVLELTGDSLKDNWHWYAVNGYNFGPAAGTFTGSAWFLYEGEDNVIVQVHLRANIAQGSTKEIASNGVTINAASGWTRLIVTVTTQEKLQSIALMVGTGNKEFNDKKLYVYHPKVEAGNRATDWTPAPEDLVPTTRTINNKALTGNVTLSAADVGAIPRSELRVGASIETSGMTFCPPTNGSNLITAIGIGAYAEGTHKPFMQVNVDKTTTMHYLYSNLNKPTPADVTGLQDALNNKVPTTRTINTKPLSSDVTLTADDVGAEECFRNPNLLGGTNVRTLTTPESDAEVRLARSLSSGAANQELRDALIGRTLTLSFRARRDSESATCSRITKENEYDIRMELKATWSKTLGGEETKETPVVTFDVEAASVQYAALDSTEQVFSKTFTMPAAEDEYNKLKDLTATIHINSKPSEGNLYAIRPKLEVSSKVTPWGDAGDSAFQTTGGTVSGTTGFNGTVMFNGNVNFQNSASPSFMFIPTDNNLRGSMVLSTPTKCICMRVRNDKDVGNTYRDLRVYPSSQYPSVAQALYLMDYIDGTSKFYRIYHEGNLFYSDRLPSTGTEGQICFVPEGT